jgi:pimeloyl-ACP methyl ester carboxylesterase
MADSKFIEAGGLSIHYLETGAGVPLILLHGGLATAEASWHEPLPKLAETYHVLAPDSRGHGRTDNPATSLSYAQMADDVAAFIEAVGVERPLIAGYSDGGQIALEFGLRHPGKARALVLGGTVDRLNDIGREGLISWGIRGPGDIDHAALAATWGDFYRALPKLHGPGQAPEHWRSLLDQISALWTGVPTYTAAQLSTIREPALVICGDRDDLGATESAPLLLAVLPKGELGIIPDADHGAVDRPLFWEIVRDFLARHAG